MSLLRLTREGHDAPIVLCQHASAEFKELSEPGRGPIPMLFTHSRVNHSVNDLDLGNLSNKLSHKQPLRDLVPPGTDSLGDTQAIESASLIEVNTGYRISTEALA